MAAWRRGVAERLLLQCVDILLALPELLLAITAITVLGRGTISTVVAVAVYAVPSFARIVRAAAQPVVGGDFVLAARAVGRLGVPGARAARAAGLSRRRSWRTRR